MGGGGVIGLGGLLALGPSDGLDGAERPVEPGLLGGLHLVESQPQMVLQVLIEEQIKMLLMAAVFFSMLHHSVSSCPL